ncbi:MAG TPA: hemolysin family protein [candidate division Zixibacteria bacterium]|jgi:CBS domain containing-hemolysin-like protein
MLVTAGAIALLLGAIYAAASAGVQLFTMADHEITTTQLRGHRARFVETLTRNPREILLAATLFKSLMFLAVVVIVVWMVPRWARQLEWPGPPFVVVGLIAVWLLRIWVGEILPRASIPDSNNGGENPRLAWLALLWWGFRPVLALTRPLHRRRTPQERFTDREEIVEHAIDSLAESAGLDEPVIEEDERRMIQGVIGLEDTEVREVMVPRINIVAVEAHDSMDKVRRLVRASGHSRLPVYDKDIDTIVGILYAKDVFCADHSDTPPEPATLARRAFFVPETKRVDALLEEFKRTKTHIAIVVDEFGGTAGLVTMEDILEEIVGEIEDEHDARHQAIERLDNMSVRADGVVPLEDVADLFEVELPEDDFETVGGLIYDRVGGVPQRGQTVSDFGLEFTVEEMDGQRIRRVRVEKRPEPKPESPVRED